MKLFYRVGFNVSTSCEGNRLFAGMRRCIWGFNCLLWGTMVWAQPPSHSVDMSVRESNRLYLEAKTLLASKKWEEAVLLLKDLQEGLPKDIGVTTDLSTALTFLKRRESALHFLIQAVNLCRDKKRCETDKKVLKKKIQVLSRAFLTNATFQIYQEGLNFFHQAKYKLARDRFEKALAQEADNVEILVRLGQSYLFEDQFGLSVEFLTRAAKLDPFEPRIRLWLGRAYQRKELSENSVKKKSGDESSRALDELEFAWENLPGSEIAPLWLAEYWGSLGQVSEALTVLNGDIKKWPLHIRSLVASARLRVQFPHPDLSQLWAARKELQLAESRLNAYLKRPSLLPSLEDSIGFYEAPAEKTLAEEIAQLMQLVQAKLDALNPG